jgi:signal transduction histidine kinase
MEASDARIATTDGSIDADGPGTDEGNAREAGTDLCVTGTEADPRERSRHASQRISALGEMTRGIAHDFRNVLALIESGLRLAESQFDDAGLCRDCLAPAHQGVERGLALTTQLLAFATPGKADTRPADANALLRNLAPFVKYGAGPGIRVTFDLADDIPDCLIDPSQFNAAMLTSS